MEELNIFNKKYTHSFTLTNDVYIAFQQCSGDFNPLHTIESFAKEKGFNSCVMYGNILNSFVSYFVGMMLPTTDVIIHSQDIMYKNPVYMGDILTFNAECKEIYESVSAVVFKFQFKNQDAKVVAKGHVQIGMLK